MKQIMTIALFALMLKKITNQQTENDKLRKTIDELKWNKDAKSEKGRF